MIFLTTIRLVPNSKILHCLSTTSAFLPCVWSYRFEYKFICGCSARICSWLNGILLAFFYLQRQLMEQKQKQKRQSRAGGVLSNDNGTQYIYSRPTTGKSKNREETKPLMDLSSTSGSIVTPLHGKQRLVNISNRSGMPFSLVKLTSCYKYMGTHKFSGLKLI